MAGYVGPGPEQEPEMLVAIGVRSFEDLLAGVPASARMKRPTAIPPGQTEEELRRLFRTLGDRNVDPEVVPSFLGAGLYDHTIPAAIRQLTLRSEFYTAYTPYQAEVAQGTLATIFEFQSILAELTGLDVANASMYDGGSAAAEAVLLAMNATGRSRVLVSEGFHPHWREVLRTYGTGPGLVLEPVPLRDGRTDLAALKSRLDDGVAAVLLQNPNFFGCIEEIAPLAAAAREAGALTVVSANLMTLGLLDPPGAIGADLAVAEAQGYGNPPQFGGPLCGILAARKDLLRRMPGRLVAEARDQDGHRGFVLTLQTREQHIRREKATSNICTNNNLVALGVTLYFTLLGPRGLQEVARQSLQKAHYLRGRLLEIPGVKAAFSAPCFHEFTLELPKPAAEVVAAILRQDRILAGFDLGRVDPAARHRLLVAVTERRTREEMDRLAAALRRCLAA